MKAYLDKQRELYDDRKRELYDEETGLFYRDRNYIYDPDAAYDPSSSGNNQKISPNGKKGAVGTRKWLGNGSFSTSAGRFAG